MSNINYNNLKIFKSATKVSLMDVKPLLSHYKEKESEIVYKGNIVFTINEYGGSKQSLQAFLPKATAKMLCELILNASFHSIYPQGFKHFGGSAKDKIARVFTITFEPNNGKPRFKFLIQEGQGQIGKNGQITMQGKAQRYVTTYLSLEDGLKMAVEIRDFIRHAELISLIKKEEKPLYSYSTFVPQQQGQPPMNQSQGFNQGYPQQSNGYHNPLSPYYPASW